MTVQPQFNQKTAENCLQIGQKIAEIFQIGSKRLNTLAFALQGNLCGFEAPQGLRWCAASQHVAGPIRHCDEMGHFPAILSF